MAEVMESLDENIVYQHKEKVTGVKINFIANSWADISTAFNLMIASNDLPDMIMQYEGAGQYPGGPSKAIADGVYIRLNELIEKNAPAFTKVINSTPDFKRQVMTDDGTIPSMGMLEIIRQPPFWGPIIRQDWLDDLGLAMPVTMADWYNVLTQFKQKKGAAAPYVMSASGMAGEFMVAYDVSTWLQRDNTVVYGYTDAGYREYLTEMNKWYREGLFHADFTTPERNVWLTNGVSGAFSTGFTEFTLIQNMIRELDPRAYVVAAPYPTKDRNSVTKIRDLNPHNREYSTSVTTACKNPDLAVQWLDWGYTDEGYMWSNYGEEGLSYTMVNGKAQWTPLIANNPEGFDLYRVMQRYTIHAGPFVRDWEAAYAPYSAEEQATLVIWNGDASHQLLTSLLSLTAEEANTNATIMADINTYVSEMALRFIRGEEPLNNWTAYVQNVRNMGLDTAVRNYQAAYDRFLARK
jgi:putative aldouronate transport system substrate-binding protein